MAIVREVCMKIELFNADHIVNVQVHRLIITMLHMYFPQASVQSIVCSFPQITSMSV